MKDCPLSWNWLWDSSVFMTRNHCGAGWTPLLEAIYKVSSLVIAGAYYAIPVALLFLCKKKWADLPNPRMLLMFVLFILLCKLINMINALVFSWAPYRLYTFTSALPAVVSAVTAFDLTVVVRYLAKLPSREYVHKINQQLNNELFHRAQIEQELAQRNEEQRGRLKALDVAMKELNQMLADLEAL